MFDTYSCLTIPALGLALVLAIIAFKNAGTLGKRLDAASTLLKELELEVVFLRSNLAALTERLTNLERGEAREVPRVEASQSVPPAQTTAAAPAPKVESVAPQPAAKPVPVDTEWVWSDPESDSADEFVPRPARQSMKPQPTTPQPTTPRPTAPRPTTSQPTTPQPTKQPAYERMAADLRENPVVSWFSGTHIVVRVGIIVLFFGVAFLFKFAADQGWLSIELRLAGAAVLGLVLSGFGWRLRRSEERRGYALTLQGGGLGILYMTTFTAFRIYHLVPGGLAFALLVVISAATVALAVVNDSRTLAIFAVAGGFAAPFLVSTGEGSHIMLFSYVAVINAVILAVAWFKSWRELNLVGFAFTVAVGLLWGTQAYTSSLFWSTEAFLILFFLFYTAITVLYASRQQTYLADPLDGILVFGTSLVAAAFQTAMMAGSDLTDVGIGFAFALLAVISTVTVALAVVNDSRFLPLSPSPAVLLRPSWSPRAGAATSCCSATSPSSTL